MKKEFDKTMNHTYMVLREESYFEESQEADYRLQMLLHNQIPGLLPVSGQTMNGEDSLYYEISSLESLEEAYQAKEMDYQCVKELLLGCMRIFSELEEYLLEPSSLVLQPEYIYIQPETKKPQFTFYPKYEKDVRKSFLELIDYILSNLDHNDQDTVMLGYQVYRITRNPNFTMQELEPLLLEKRNADLPILQETSWKNQEEEMEAFEQSIPSDETILLTPQMRDTWQDKSAPKETKKKINFKKPELRKPKIKSEELSTDLVGMLIAVGVILIVGAILFASMNVRSIQLSSKVQMYLVGIIVMAFLSIGLLGYSYSKKRMLEEKMEL